MKRLVLSIAIAAAAFSALPAGASDTKVPTVLRAHHQVMRWDGFNSAWYFGELRTILEDARTGDPIEGQTVKFFHDDAQFCEGVTNKDGVALCSDPEAQVTTFEHGGYTARFEGTEEFVGSSASAKRGVILGNEF